MLNFELEMELEILCECGENLTEQSEADYYFSGNGKVRTVKVMPCKACTEAEKGA